MAKQQPPNRPTPPPAPKPIKENGGRQSGKGVPVPPKVTTTPPKK